MARKTIVIAGGGTGGHIYPALAIAKAIQSKDADVEIHFVGTPAGLESKIVPRDGFPLHLMKIGKLNHEGGWLAKIKTLLRLPGAFVQSAALVMELKPIAVLGVGGYASGPFVLTASLLGFRSAIWEPNAHPGLTNRWLSRFVRRSYVVFADAAKQLKSREILSVGLPVRREVESLGTQAGTREDQDFHVLVFGGSQGARAVNTIVKEAVLKGTEWRRGIRLIHQTGVHDYGDISKAYAGLSGIEAHEYLHDMDRRYAWADLIVCRSGASTVAELAATRKPSILVPLPTAADDHQRKNAESLVRQQGAVMILQDQLTPERLIEEILKLKNDSKGREDMRQNLGSFHQPQAAEKIADLMLSAEN